MRSTNSCTRRAVSALALALCLLASACGARAEDLASDLGGGFVAADPAQTQTASDADMQNADVYIGYIDVGYPLVSPVNCTEWDMISINQLVYEPLVDVDESMKPIPMLADSWEQNGRYWQFNLRSGIQFHNGYELTAYDVQRSYEAIIAAGENNPYYARLQVLRSLQATDVYTLVAEGRTTGILTLYAMNFPVMQYETVYDEIPRGTGPYWYIQYDPDGAIRLEANPLWWKRQPAIKSILLRRYADAGDAIEAMQRHQISLLSTKSPKASYSRKLADLISLDYPTLTYEMLVPNLNEASLLSDVNVRRAVMYAIDRATLASNAYVDMAIQCEVPIVPTCWLYESQSAVYYYSPERALQLMNNAGWYDLTGDGRLNKRSGIMLKEPVIRLITYNENTNSIRANAADMIAAYLQDVGFTVDVVVESRERVREDLRSRNFDLALVGVNLSEIPDISAILRSGGSLNLNRYSNEEMDEMIERAQALTDETELKKAYSDIQLTVVDRLPILGLLFRTGTVLSTRNLGGLSGLRAYDNFNGFEFLE